MSKDSRNANPKSRPKKIRTILDNVHTGALKLPRFQRRVSWKLDFSRKLMESVLNGYPVGLLLTLASDEVDKTYVTRQIPGVRKTTNPCSELLLDGQQRIMSLYRIVEDNFEKSFVIGFRSEFAEDKYRDDEEGGVGLIEINKLDKKKKKLEAYKYPKDLGTNKFFPAWLLSPFTEVFEVDKWIDDHIKLQGEDVREIYREINPKFLNFEIPVTRLPRETKKGRAISIFIQMNRSVTKLSAFDIAVAQMEKKIGKSFHDRVEEIGKRFRVLGNFGTGKPREEKKIGELILRVFCLRQGKSPTEKNLFHLDFEEIDREWKTFKKAVERMNELLSQEKIWDQKHLPSLVPLHVVIALFMSRPSDAFEAGFYDSVLKKYLWRAFLSDRYSYSANKHMEEDYKKLLKELGKGEDFSTKELETNVPIFGYHPQIKYGESKEDQEKVGWPSSKARLAKAILALTFEDGAKDLATAASPTSETIGRYQFHHIYPKKYMEPNKNNFWVKSVFNCMLIDPKTNIKIGAKSPREYLEEIKNKAKCSDSELRRRLETHSVPVDILLKSEPRSNRRKEREENFEEFIKERIRIFNEKIQEKCDLSSVANHKRSKTSSESRKLRKSNKNKEIRFSLLGEEHSESTEWRAYVKIVEILAGLDSELLARLAPKLQGRTRRHIAQRRKDLAKHKETSEAAAELPGGWFLITRLSNDSKIKNLKVICETAGISFGDPEGLQVDF